MFLEKEEEKIKKNADSPLFKMKSRLIYVSLPGDECSWRHFSAQSLLRSFPGEAGHVLEPSIITNFLGGYG